MAELDGQAEASKPHRQQYERAIGRWQQVAEWFRANPTASMGQEGLKNAEDAIASLKAALALPEPPPLETWSGDPLRHVSEVGKWAWGERFAQQERQRSSGVTTMQQAIVDFLGRAKAKALSGQISHARHESLRCHLDHFAQVVGGSTPVASINAAMLMHYHTALTGLIGSKTITQSTAWSRMHACRQFVRHCWTLELCELPRNVNGPDLSITVSPVKVQTYTVEEVHQFFAAVPRRAKLCLALMLNCGMLQKDIADLRQSEINWSEGRITRKRSKTRLNEDVPEVGYKLWPLTFKLLKEHRGSHPELVLVNDDGRPLYSTAFKDDGKLKKSDNIGDQLDRWRRKLGIIKPIKLLRKTSPSLLATNPRFANLRGHFLGHAARGMADKHYTAMPQALLDEAIEWLGKQYALKLTSKDRVRRDGAEPAKTSLTSGPDGSRPRLRQ